MAMPFDEVRFPSGLAFGSTFGPSFETAVVVLLEGAEHRNSNWARARWKGDCRYAVKTLTELKELQAFALARRGKRRGFRFKHHLDYQAVLEPCIVRDATHFQLAKTYTVGNATYVRPIVKPVGVGFPLGTVINTVTFFVGTTPYGGATLNYATGYVTTAGAPGGVLNWSGEFDVAVRFDTDVNLAQLTIPTIGQIDSIPLIELKEALTLP